ncbi:hypothetical protein N7466_001552 [Penicillium verhagenii]|uniref:uncharacterized protein n=1 Tax=Penicillium verhagenii TaxID=1562060 RepID=UPI002544F137|nr:uncharacterized protein N7466_001552 [Penicillium verhagenii]KAJ5938418.1 hypothetical protein N7466_001552 [Penicillium verhagenii]
MVSADQLDWPECLPRQQTPTPRPRFVGRPDFASRIWNSGKILSVSSSLDVFKSAKPLSVCTIHDMARESSSKGSGSRAPWGILRDEYRQEAPQDCMIPDHYHVCLCEGSIPSPTGGRRSPTVRSSRPWRSMRLSDPIRQKRTIESFDEQIADGSRMLRIQAVSML